MFLSVWFQVSSSCPLNRWLLSSLSLSPLSCKTFVNMISWSSSVLAYDNVNYLEVCGYSWSNNWVKVTAVHLFFHSLCTLSQFWWLDKSRILTAYCSHIIFYNKNVCIFSLEFTTQFAIDIKELTFKSGLKGFPLIMFAALFNNLAKQSILNTPTISDTWIMCNFQPIFFMGVYFSCFVIDCIDCIYFLLYRYWVI